MRVCVGRDDRIDRQVVDEAVALDGDVGGRRGGEPAPPSENAPNPGSTVAAGAAAESPGGAVLAATAASAA